MEAQMAQIQQHLEAAQQVQETAAALYDKGLIKQQQDGSWLAVESFEEQQKVLKQREEDANRAQELHQIVNVNPPPEIDPQRQRPSQQLELND